MAASERVAGWAAVAVQRMQIVVVLVRGCEAGHGYEIRTVKGYRAVPWQRLNRSADRAEIIRLSGTPEVPILVLDDGTVVSDSSRIVRWAREHRAVA